MSVDDLLRWADRYNTERDGHWFERLDATRTENLHELPWKIKGRMHINLSDIGRKSIPTGRLESVRCLSGIVRAQFDRPVDFVRPGQSARLWGR
ncbi:hypothetical protein ARMGADRAFT_1019175 [Armillaria gallica]|uniref:Uncharacterized protein n=1 Tax=Armillaria gallica TaxID=47427 RepID=A0A2H3D4Y8_ARMGA|nr:hypothetical protein ARMGADRAFT_1019175 [Armillaria gallica]